MERTDKQRCNHCMTVQDEANIECESCGKDDALMYPFMSSDKDIEKKDFKNLSQDAIKYVQEGYNDPVAYLYPKYKAKFGLQTIKEVVADVQRIIEYKLKSTEGFYLEFHGEQWQSVFPEELSEHSQLHTTLDDGLDYMVNECGVDYDSIKVNVPVKFLHKATIKS